MAALLLVNKLNAQEGNLNKSFEAARSSLIIKDTTTNKKEVAQKDISDVVSSIFKNIQLQAALPIQFLQNQFILLFQQLDIRYKQNWQQLLQET